jgi:hypothetical protein
VIIPPGSTSVSVDVFFADDTGAALTGKVAADFPACKWSGGDNTADTTITLSDLAAITTAHPNNNTAGGVKEREGGWYRLDVPNNVFTSAGRKRLTFAETTNKRIIAPFIDVQYVQGDVRQILGTTLTETVAGYLAAAFKKLFDVTTPVLTSASVNQTGDGYAIVNDSSFGNAKLVRSTTPANTLDVSGTGEAGLDFANIKDATGAHTLMNITVPVVSAVTGNVGGNIVGNLLGTLTTTERTAIANAVETEIIDETDSEKVLTAITDKIASVNPSLSGLTLAAIAAAVRDVSNASPAGSSLGAAVNAVPTAAANATATLAATADGVATSTILARLNALARGLASVTNNGNGTYTLAFKLQDGTSTAFTVTYNPTTGART